MERLDKETYLKRVIVVCWIALAICFGIKLFGGNLFEIMCKNENFIKVCNYIDNHYWADYLIYTSYSFVLNYFFILSIMGEWKYKKHQFIIFTITILFGVAIKNISSTIGILFDIWQMVIMPTIFLWKNKRRILFVFIGNVALVFFQVASMYIKNIEIGILTNNGALMSTIYCVDVLIMILLYYFYSNILRKGKKDG